MSPRPRTPLAAAVLLLLVAAPALRAAEGPEPGYRTDLDYAQVEFVRAVRGPDGLWCLAATVRHRDEGWEHYADAWEALDPEGGRIAERVLAHPHETEQPFTRQQCGVRVPAGVRQVRVRAKCNRHGFGGREVVVDLATAGGEGFSVSQGEAAP